MMEASVPKSRPYSPAAGSTYAETVSSELPPPSHSAGSASLRLKATIATCKIATSTRLHLPCACSACSMAPRWAGGSTDAGASQHARIPPCLTNGHTPESSTTTTDTGVGPFREMSSKMLPSDTW